MWGKIFDAIERRWCRGEEESGTNLGENDPEERKSFRWERKIFNVAENRGRIDRISYDREKRV